MLGPLALPGFGRWLSSGTPVLAYAVLLGESHHHRILSFVPVWAMFAAVTLTYAVCSTSWLLYLVFTGLCWPTILVTCLRQFDAPGRLARRLLRKVFLRNLHFINDQIGLFNIPALEIDTEVKGLFVVRAITLSISTMTLVAHGVEAGIKLSDEIELAIQTDKVVVRLFRDIHVDDVYANVKGGDWEVTFGDLAYGKSEPSGDPDDFIARDTAILRAATTALDGTFSRPKRASTMVRTMTADRQPVEAQDQSSAFSSVKTLSSNETLANREHEEMIEMIYETSLITQAKESLRKAVKQDDETPGKLDLDNMNDMRAAVCAHIHNSPSIPHPPTTSIRVSTLSKTSYPRVKEFLHRLPLLYRLMLSPLCYLHHTKLQSVTVAGSGKWLVVLMRKYLFKHYSSRDSEIRKLEERISAWYEDATFALELGPVSGEASFPVSTKYDIQCHLKVSDVLAYRVLPAATQLEQVVRLGGGDALLTIPTFLFPHHEHIFPPMATEYELLELEARVKQMEEEGTPEAAKARRELRQRRKDQANMRISAHAHLPARFHQHLLNFVAALVKATKLIERDNAFEEAKITSLHHEVESLSSTGTAGSGDTADTTMTAKSNNSGFRDFMKKVDTGLKTTSVKTVEGMRKAGFSTLSAMANDRWIAALVGKVTRKLESAQGEVGYSFDVPISLDEARSKHESPSKLLP
ncbi:uncharacterized protein B0I36DRAFT_376469 [Microdochium trichocladiopsis]|uniref:Uncharacterized protein n=1 Tax=Microdochium trichocladiopsis TaxID=1682393 RepID=A0A9P9BL23_9PEZI|nr:uncharacterized protein B0I36DRAFT_376469 [Microdochium trichocladiopsis]KAH7024492.1 hypothetical protein B0I36DRAFT_376469 [Microdochium trichocladiopsis]